ncbi:MAG: hypothetical protein OXC58_09885 [Acidimicrobiaceae bacterium]|nr:hypothetical protein [Acidimicrobiaceae bacterium]
MTHPHHPPTTSHEPTRHRITVLDVERRHDGPPPPSPSAARPRRDQRVRRGAPAHITRQQPHTNQPATGSPCSTWNAATTGRRRRRRQPPARDGINVFDVERRPASPAGNLTRTDAKSAVNV